MSAGPIPSGFSTHDAFEPGKYVPFILGQVQWVRRPGEGDRPALSAGFWHVTTAEAPQPFDLLIEADEPSKSSKATLHIEIEGGESFDLTPGSAASFNKGTRWTVVEDATEFFIYS